MCFDNVSQQARGGHGQCLRAARHGRGADKACRDATVGPPPFCRTDCACGISARCRSDSTSAVLSDCADCILGWLPMFLVLHPPPTKFPRRLEDGTAANCLGFLAPDATQDASRPSLARDRPGTRGGTIAVTQSHHKLAVTASLV
jgi:hypothetical protein